MSSFSLHDAADVAGIVAAVVTVVLALVAFMAYLRGAIRPLKATGAQWNHAIYVREGKPDAQAIFVAVTLKSRTRDDQTVSAAGFARDPGWWRRRLPNRRSNLEVTPFTEPQRTDLGQLAINNRNGADLYALLVRKSLPYEKDTRLWIRIAGRNFYPKLTEWQPNSGKKAPNEEFVEHANAGTIEPKPAETPRPAPAAPAGPQAAHQPTGDAAVGVDPKTAD